MTETIAIFCNPLITKQFCILLKNQCKWISGAPIGAPIKSRIEPSVYVLDNFLIHVLTDAAYWVERDEESYYGGHYPAYIVRFGDREDAKNPQSGFFSEDEPLSPNTPAWLKAHREAREQKRL